MRNPYDPTLDPAGYADCVLSSDDDYEPYGYAATEATLPRVLQPRDDTRFDRVIEAQILGHLENFEVPVPGRMPRDFSSA
jgi:hypothetical protein